MDMEATVMELIINAGESRSLAMQALQAPEKECGRTLIG